ncbi:MAG TPA: amidohydrolase family protein [Acidimicrobiia bacterium]|nr:amidohydrolase family protein [Acidimicrobiia bacterium]
MTAGRVLTADGVVGDTLVLEDGRVAAVTGRTEVGEMEVLDHGGATIVPGLIDSHLHPVGFAGLVSGTSLKDATDIDDLIARIAAVETAGAVIAQRFDDTSVGRMPTRYDLDRAVPDRPVVAYRYCGHIAVANTAALDLAAVGPGTTDPPGGSFDRDADGIPTGVLRETAVGVVNAAVEPLAPAPTDAALLTALEGLVACGLTRITAMAATAKPLWCGVGDEVATLCRLAADLPLDVDVVVIVETPDDLRRAASDIGEAGGRLRFWGWKEFADGSLGGHTAAMWSPFLDVPTSGTVRLDPGHAENMARTALDLGGAVAIHAIGDRAIDMTLDLYDGLTRAGADPGRLRIEHLSVASSTAIGRLAASGYAASVQPSFLTSEASWVSDRLGKERPAYRFAAMEAAGVNVIAGSDCPVERPDPLIGIAASVQRPGWHDDEAVAVETALGWYTSAPSAHLGLAVPLAPGSPADFAVVEGEVGSPDAKVVAVYREGVRQEVKPVPWPG